MLLWSDVLLHVTWRCHNTKHAIKRLVLFKHDVLTEVFLAQPGRFFPQTRRGTAEFGSHLFSPKSPVAGVHIEWLSLKGVGCWT